MSERNNAQNAVSSVPHDVFWGDIQKNILTSYPFSKLRCGGESDLTEEEQTYLNMELGKYFPGYDFKNDGHLALAYALTEREMSRA